MLFVEFIFDVLWWLGLMYGDVYFGNFMLLFDGWMGIIDFGVVVLMFGGFLIEFGMMI